MNDIPATWPRICGLSLDRTNVGAVWLAHDRREKVIYAYGEFVRTLPELPMLADALRARGDWIRVVMDGQAFRRTKVEGAAIMGRLLDLGVEIVDARFDDEAGAEEMRKALMTGKMRVPETMKRWLSEFDLYNRDERSGKLPEKGFHLMRGTGMGLMFDPEEWISENRAESNRVGMEPGDRSRNKVTGY